MLIGLKIFGVCIGVYAGIRMTGIGMQYLKKFFDDISPKKNRWDDD